jgi:hypothetical protein
MIPRHLGLLVVFTTVLGLVSCGIERRHDRREERRDDRKDLVSQSHRLVQPTAAAFVGDVRRPT